MPQSLYTPAAIINVGDRIKFKSEKQRYTARARNKRYIICTKPFNARKTVLYTIIDIENNIRGTDNLIFSMGYENNKQIALNMRLLEEGQMEVSHRNRIPLDIEYIEHATT